MLTVTVAARMRLLEKLDERKAADHVAMRFTRKEGVWKLGPDRMRPADTVFDHEGRNVLLLDDQVAAAMTDKTLDVRKTKAGLRLTLR